MPRAMTAASWTSIVGDRMSEVASASIAGFWRWKQSSADLKRELLEGSSDVGTAGVAFLGVSMEDCNHEGGFAVRGAGANLLRAGRMG